VGDAKFSWTKSLQGELKLNACGNLRLDPKIINKTEGYNSIMLDLFELNDEKII